MIQRQAMRDRGLEAGCDGCGEEMLGEIGVARQRTWEILEERLGRAVMRGPTPMQTLGQLSRKKIGPMIGCDGDENVGCCRGELRAQRTIGKGEALLQRGPASFASRARSAGRGWRRQMRPASATKRTEPGDENLVLHADGCEVIAQQIGVHMRRQPRHIVGAQCGEPNSGAIS